jgi:hypothetical protein
LNVGPVSRLLRHLLDSSSPESKSIPLLAEYSVANQSTDSSPKAVPPDHHLYKKKTKQQNFLNLERFALCYPYSLMLCVLCLILILSWLCNEDDNGVDIHEAVPRPILLTFPVCSSENGDNVAMFPDGWSKESWSRNLGFFHFPNRELDRDTNC